MSVLLRYRDEFPVVDRIVYFNHAATGPLPRRSAEAMQRHAESQMLRGGMDYREWLESYEGLRTATAQLIRARSSEIAITKNTSEGLSFLANGIDWRSGDVAVGVAGDFPANYFPWARLDRRGVRLRWVEQRGGRLDLAAIDEACRDARLLAVSYVHYLSGFRLDLRAVGEICRRRGCLLIVDAVQGLGPFPVDVRSCGIHGLAASAHKWLLGPEGCAILFVDGDLLPRVEPVEFGWTNVRGFPSYSHEEALRPDAGRFECGTLNTIGCYGMRASVELFLEAGVEAVRRRVDELADSVIAKAAAKGYRPLTWRDELSGSGIVSLIKDGVDAGRTAAALAQDGISVSARHGWLRIAPHFYNSDEEVARLVYSLP